MPAPTFFAANVATSSLGSISPDWPANHAIGDIGLMIVETSGNAATLAITGWTHVTGSPLADVATTAGSKLQILWRRATSAAEAAQATGDSGDHQAVQMFVFRGCETSGNPWNVIASATKTTASTTATCPTVTTTVPDCLIVFVASRPDDDAADHFGVPVNAALTGLAEADEFGGTAGNGGGAVCSYGTKAAAGVVGTTTMSNTVSLTDVTFTIALQPPGVPYRNPMPQLIAQ